jgi:hypothetical protein
VAKEKFMITEKESLPNIHRQKWSIRMLTRICNFFVSKKRAHFLGEHEIWEIDRHTLHFYLAREVG